MSIIVIVEIPTWRLKLLVTAWYITSLKQHRTDLSKEMSEAEEAMLENEEGESNDVNMDDAATSNVDKTDKPKHQVYLPGKPLREGEELVCDESAYVLLREIQTGISNYNLTETTHINFDRSAVFKL